MGNMKPNKPDCSVEVVDDTTMLFSCAKDGVLINVKTAIRPINGLLNENFIGVRFLGYVRLRFVILQNINMQKITYENSDSANPRIWW